MKKSFVSNLFAEKPVEQSFDFVYFKRLPYVMQKLVPFFFDSGNTILDVTSGEKKSWAKSLFDTNNVDTGEPYCKVIFLDGSQNAESDIRADFRKIPLPDNSVDIIYFDPPFTEVKNSQESHGVKGSKGRRKFYFRGIGSKWIPPEAYFFQTWREFNRVSRNGLIVKISERFQDLEEVPVLTYMDLAYNKRFNKKSQFSRCVNIVYRGKRKATGARSSNPQRVFSNYAVYKKDRRQR